MRKSEAIRLRRHIETAVQSLSDSDALEAVTLYQEWATGQTYAAGYKVQHGGKLCRCLQAHTSQAGGEPETAASLWPAVCGTSGGTQYDPNPYDGNMALEAGLYYTQGGVVYLFNRDTGQPVYNALADLVGIYVEVAE